MKKYFYTANPLSSAEQSIVQGTNAANQNNLQSFILTPFKSFGKFAMCLTLLLTVTIQSVAVTSPITLDYFDEVVKSIITMEGDILLTDTGDSNDNINSIEIFDSSQNLVHVENSLDASSCSTNLSHLNAGHYFVVCETTTGQTSGWIEKM